MALVIVAPFLVATYYFVKNSPASLMPNIQYSAHDLGEDPKSILNAQLRKNTVGFMGKSGPPKPTLKQLSDKKYQVV